MVSPSDAEILLHDLQRGRRILRPPSSPVPPLCPVPGNDSADMTHSGEEAAQRCRTENIQSAFRIGLLQRFDGGERLHQITQSSHLNHQTAGAGEGSCGMVRYQRAF